MLTCDNIDQEAGCVCSGDHGHRRINFCIRVYEMVISDRMLELSTCNDANPGTNIMLEERF